MEDELDQSEKDGITNEAANQPQGFDLGTFKSELLDTVNQSFDERFKGFQKMLAKRDKQFDEFVKTYQGNTQADWTEEERQAYADKEKDDQIARLQMALELKELEREFPDAAPVFNEILEQDSPRAQLELLQKRFFTKEELEQAQEDQSKDVPGQNKNASVDPNSPADTGTDGMNYDDMFEKDPSLLDRILKGAGRMRDPS